MRAAFSLRLALISALSATLVLAAGAGPLDSMRRRAPASAPSSSARSIRAANRSRDLVPTDFVITEDGRRREVLRVSRGGRADRHRRAGRQQRRGRARHPVAARRAEGLRRRAGRRQSDRDRRAGRSADDSRRLHVQPEPARGRRRPHLFDELERHDAARRDHETSAGLRRREATARGDRARSSPTAWNSPTATRATSSGRCRTPASRCTPSSSACSTSTRPKSASARCVMDEGTRTDRRPARHAAHRNRRRTGADEAGAPALVAVQSGVRPARVADSAGKDRSRVGPRGSHHARHAGARTRLEPDVNRMFLAVVCILALPRRRRRRIPHGRRPAPVVPDDHRHRLAQRHGDRRRQPLHHRPRAARLLGLRGRRQAGHRLLHAPAAADRAVAAARQQREHGRQARDAAGRRHQLRPAPQAERPRPGHRLRQPRLDPAGASRRTRPSSKARSARRSPAARPRCTTRSTSRSRSSARSRRRTRRTSAARR